MIVRAASKKPRVLLVDDDPFVRRALARVLAREYEVVAVDGGRAALALIRCGDRFDAIVCDVAMPGMSGLELSAALDRVAPDQASRMIALTGGAVDPAGLAARFGDRYLIKPVRAAELEETILAVIRLAEVA
jgi:two-component system, NtrC family, sensor kinase